MSKSPFSLLPLAILMAFCEWAYAQAPTGNISGIVKDGVGAVIPSATVTTANKATDFNRALTANAEGLYSAPALALGEYEVRVEMQGFRTLVQRPLWRAAARRSTWPCTRLGPGSGLRRGRDGPDQLRQPHSPCFVWP
jgi:hypothetical protein